MKLGVHIGYWGLGLTADEQLKLVLEAESLGYDSVWTAEAYGSDAATILGWLAQATTTIKLGSAILQMPGRSRRHDGDDGRHARPALRRAHAARDRLLRPAGGRGLARPALRQAAPAHARVHRGGADGAGPRAGRVRRRDARAAAPRRPRQGAEADDRPRAGADPDLPGRDRPQEHDAGRRDRRRLDPDAVLPRAHGRVPPAARGGLRRGRATRRSTTSTSPRRSTCSSPTTSTPPATRCAPTSRCTSAAWARASRTSTTRSCSATASRTRRRRSRTSTSRARRRRPPRRCPASCSTRCRCAARPTWSRERLGIYRDAGVGTLIVSPMAWTFEDRISQLRQVAELAS